MSRSSKESSGSRNSRRSNLGEFFTKLQTENSFSIGTIPGFMLAIDNEFSAVLKKGKGGHCKKEESKKCAYKQDENRIDDRIKDNQKGGKKMSSKKECKKNYCEYLYYKWLIENGNNTPVTPDFPETPDFPGDQFSDLRRILLRLLGRTVTVSTDFAPVTGILSAIEADYIVISEAAGTVVFVPFRAINSVREPI
ncbi:DUF2642 domain-containing protein [Peribacillus muralis]|uniref:DUF2642 domain-containing protein n=1 Tax=Peribacillus muralis TaxID=264697 RepID=UPI003D07908A